MRVATITILLFLSACCLKAEEKTESPGTLVAKFDFEEQFQKARNADMIQKGFINNYAFGKKDIVFSADEGVHGKSQKIDIRGISSGELQFFSPAWGLWRGKYYKISFWCKSDGLDGELSCNVRKISQPWTIYIKGINIKPTQNWKEYSFWGQAPNDIDNDFGVLFTTGAIGRIWIDDITIESFDNPPGELITNSNPLIEGNLLPRSSYEGTKDYFWTNGIYTNRAKPWYGDWLDPRIYRAEGGMFGTYCMGIPVPANSGDVFVRSYLVPVAKNTPYTYSVYLKTANKPQKIAIGISPYPKGTVSSKGITVTDKWQRFEVTAPDIPPECSQVVLTITCRSNSETYNIFADAFQFEHGNTASIYKAAYPSEITLCLANSNTNIVTWGEKFPLSIYVGSADKQTQSSEISATLRLTAFPDKKIYDSKIVLKAGSENKITIDPKRNGIFRIELIPDSPSLAAPVEMLAGRLPIPRDTGIDSMFGSHISVRPFFLEYAKAIGIKWNRLHDASNITKWGGVEPEQGKVQWADEQVDAMKSAGFQILGLPDYPPDWARSKDSSKPFVEPSAYMEHCRRVAEHYAGRIDYWEIWNEPYISYFFPRSAEEFAVVFEAGAKGIKKGNPNAKVLGFCTEINGTGYASHIPQKVREYPDIISFHCYFSNLTGGGTAGFDREIQEYKKFMGANGPKEYWNTEGALQKVGANSFYSFINNPDINAQAVAFCSRVWQEQRKAGINKVFIYTLHQSDTMPHTGGYKKLIGFDRSITPAATATAVTAYAIDGLNPVATKNINGIVQSLFTDGKRHTWSLFKDPAFSGKCVINLQNIPHDYTIFDPMGNDPRKDGLKEWTPDIQPLFISTEHESLDAFYLNCQNSLNSEQVKSN